MKTTDHVRRRRVLRRFLFGAVAALLAKAFVSILLEYRWYFPANFDSAAFLIGRREVFTPIYSAAFYTHIVSGPTAILLGAYLWLSGMLGGPAKAHAWAGRLLVSIATVLVAPSGLVLAYRAHAGPMAGVGFALLALATAGSAVAAVRHAQAHNFRVHRRWATRCLILLGSPLILRLIGGWAIVLGLESESFYIANAWLSWLVPLTAYELALRTNVSSAIRAAPAHNYLPQARA